MSTTQLTLSDNELIDKYYVGEEEKETETVAPIMSNNELIDKYYVGEEEEETRSSQRNAESGTQKEEQAEEERTIKEEIEDQQ